MMPTIGGGIFKERSSNLIRLLSESKLFEQFFVNEQNYFLYPIQNDLY